MLSPSEALRNMFQGKKVSGKYSDFAVVAQVEQYTAGVEVCFHLGQLEQCLEVVMGEGNHFEASALVGYNGNQFDFATRITLALKAPFKLFMTTSESLNTLCTFLKDSAESAGFDFLAKALGLFCGNTVVQFDLFVGTFGAVLAINVDEYKIEVAVTKTFNGMKFACTAFKNNKIVGWVWYQGCGPPPFIVPFPEMCPLGKKCVFNSKSVTQGKGWYCKGDECKTEESCKKLSKEAKASLGTENSGRSISQVSALVAAVATVVGVQLWLV
jgi:hypothetical protein